jgi:DNA-binding MarR family transcriptional regulator
MPAARVPAKRAVKRKTPSGPERQARRARPAPARPADPHRTTVLAVVQLFRLIFGSAKKHFKWVQERTGVSGAQLWALAELKRQPGIRVTELARALAVHQSTASNLVEPLERRGLLRRARAAQDQRVVELFLTDLGRRTLASAPRPLEGVLPDALNALGHDELLELQARLERLARSLKVRDRGGRRVPLADI